MMENDAIEHIQQPLLADSSEFPENSSIEPRATASPIPTTDGDQISGAVIERTEQSLYDKSPNIPDRGIDRFDSAVVLPQSPDNKSPNIPDRGISRFDSAVVLPQSPDNKTSPNIPDRGISRFDSAVVLSQSLDTIDGSEPICPMTPTKSEHCPGGEETSEDEEIEKYKEDTPTHNRDAFDLTRSPLLDAIAMNGAKRYSLTMGNNDHRSSLLVEIQSKRNHEIGDDLTPLAEILEIPNLPTVEESADAPTCKNCDQVDIVPLASGEGPPAVDIVLDGIDFSLEGNNSINTPVTEGAVMMIGLDPSVSSSNVVENDSVLGEESRSASVCEGNVAVMRDAVNINEAAEIPAASGSGATNKDEGVIIYGNRGQILVVVEDAANVNEDVDVPADSDGDAKNKYEGVIIDGDRRQTSIGQADGATLDAVAEVGVANKVGVAIADSCIIGEKSVGQEIADSQFVDEVKDAGVLNNNDRGEPSVGEGVHFAAHREGIVVESELGHDSQHLDTSIQDAESTVPVILSYDMDVNEGKSIAAKAAAALKKQDQTDGSDDAQMAKRPVYGVADGPPLNINPTYEKYYRMLKMVRSRLTQSCIFIKRVFAYTRHLFFRGYLWVQ